MKPRDFAQAAIDQMREMRAANPNDGYMMIVREGADDGREPPP